MFYPSHIYKIIAGLFIVLIISARLHGESAVQFTNLSYEKGLSNSTVTSIYQDDIGFIWAGTAKGLNRYDGHNFKTWSSNIAQRHINCFLQFDSKNLLFGTGFGLGWYNYDADTFKFYLPNRRNSFGEHRQNISCLYRDSKGEIWIGCYNGLCKLSYDEKGVRFTFLEFKVNNQVDTPGNINKIIEDAQGVLWVFCDNGIWYLHQNNILAKATIVSSELSQERLNVFDAILDYSGNLLISSANGLFYLEYQTTDVLPKIWLTNALAGTKYENYPIRNLAYTDDSVLWFDILDQGVFVVSEPLQQPQKLKIENHRYSSVDIGAIASNSINDIYCDKNGIIWIATDDNGLSIYNKYGFHISSIQPNEYVLSSLPFGEVTAMAKNRRGCLWVAIQGKGLYYQAGHAATFARVNSPSFNNARVNDLFVNKNDELFAVVNHDKYGGLLKIHISPSFYQNYQSESLVVENLSDKYLPQDTKKGLCAAANDSGTIFYSSAECGIFQIVMNSYLPPAVKYFPQRQNVVCFDYDNDGNLWLGANNFYQFNLATGKMTRVRPNRPVDIMVDNDGNVWLATTNHGIIRYKPSDETSVLYALPHGLTNKHVMSIEKDEHNNIWIGTLNGLSMINVQSTQIRIFNQKYGLLNLDFYERVSCKAPDGTLYFGGKKGVDYFHPSEYYKKIPNDAKIVFTDLLVNGHPVAAEPDNHKAIITTALFFADKVTLQPEHEQFTISFADLGYSNSNQLQYRYRLNEFEKYWRYCDADDPVASYGRLKSGVYTLLVESTNMHGNWNNNTASLKILVKPRLYETWGFRGAIVLVTIWLIYLIVMLRVRLLKQQKLQLERKVEQRTDELKKANRQLAFEKEKTLQHQEQMHQMKLQFFTNISHEFRTPLTLMKLALEHIMGSRTNAQALEKNISICQKNNQILLSLVNEIMDFRKLETGHAKLHAHPYNLNEILHEITEPFVASASSKNIAFIFHLEKNIELWLDKDKFTKIIHNILSNALKHTKQEGTIKIFTSSSPLEHNDELLHRHQVIAREKPLTDYIEIAVEDNGVGISGEAIKAIFNRFYQVENFSKNVGTGIGLEYTKQLMLLHKADMEVSSKEQLGTRFSLRFPTGNGYLSADEMAYTGSMLEIVPNESPLPNAPKPTAVEHKPAIDKSIQMLIVEDNDDLREYLVDIFSNYYTVIQAVNGKVGLSEVREHLPDLVLSDVMMPELSGTQLCKLLKEDIETSHIPVILLSAQTSFDHQRTGMQTGADLYIPKPFDKQMLVMQVNNLIATRRSIIHSQKQGSSWLSAIPSGNQLDKDFLENAATIIQGELQNSNFNVDELAARLDMSYKTFQRKIKALKGITPSDFIKEVRLDTAYGMLLKTKLTVSEIAFETGFYDASHFARVFKERYQVSPTEYRQNR